LGLFCLTHMKKNGLAFLAPGDEAAIIAIGKKVEKEDILPAVRIIEGWGLKPRLGKNIFKSHLIFAGSDNERLSDLQEMIDDRNIKAIFCARGGYGATRILDRVNFSSLAGSPKWIVGFSDVSALLVLGAEKHFYPLHGPMPFQYGLPEYARSVESVRTVLFGQPYSIYSEAHPFNIQGEVRAEVTGGNITMLVHSTGVPSSFDPRGKILLLEEVEEYLYRLDRLMTHLKRAGKLEGLAGVIVGHMTNMQDNDTPYGKTAYEIVLEYTAGLGVPVCFGFPSGHEPDNMAVPFNVPARFSVSRDGALLEFEF